MSQAGKTRTDNKSYNIKSLKIVPSSGVSNAVDVSYLMHELNIYEDMFSPTITGDLTVGDSNDLIKNMPLLGQEFLVIEFGKPGSDDTITKNFRIFKPDDITPKVENMSHQLITLNFCSEERVLNAGIKVSKSYKGKLYSDIVNDILNKVLKVDSKRIGTVETTSGIHDHIVPWTHPFQLINTVAARTIPTSMFFENMAGYNFVTLKTLFSKTPKVTYSYGYPNVAVSGQQDDLNPLLQVFRFEYLKATDTLESLRNGMFGSLLTTVDILRRKHDVVKLDYNKEFGNKKHVESSPNQLITQVTDRLGKTITQYPGALHRLYVTTISQPNPNQIEQWMLQKVMTMNELNHFKLKLVVPGNPAIMAGDMFTFTVPAMVTHDASAPDNSSNPYHSGNYIITALRHKFNFATYEMIIEGTRDCTTKALPGGGDQGSVNAS